jgi:lipoprotein-anchoring transpeptidase ErfK/SrfK
MPEKKKKNSKKKEFTRNQKIALYAIGGIAIFVLSILITNIVISNLTATNNVNEINATVDINAVNNCTNDVENCAANEINEVVENNTVNETTNTTTVTESGLGTTAEEKAELLRKYSSSPYYIKVNKQCNVVTVYTKDSSGNYTVPYKAMLCATGPYTPPTNKKAVYKKAIYAKEDYKRRWGTLQGHNGHTYVYGQYVSGIVDNVLFHSSTYLEKEKQNTLEWEEFNKLGTSASAGCVRLCVRDVKWIYDNVPANTLIEFYEDSNPGPLGKPTLPKIPSDSPNRGWDPTDPDPNNPWNKKEEPKQETNTNTNTSATNSTNNTAVEPKNNTTNTTNATK